MIRGAVSAYGRQGTDPERFGLSAKPAGKILEVTFCEVVDLLRFNHAGRA